ncbi:MULTISPECIES: hypothetical protein [unclassified Microbacterium]|uniref:hypothetical protein n=1 Tax=unclassified Microbacterium TaxID=2609290 RepID=UPI0016054C86|nr:MULTISPECIES: hypothetical protein [unclassified Microbacterium]QNA93874.1 hypothetical protein G4G29_19200 [Microbacterium sp. Se63.02b]QYM64175.1 hypothetical protein K1X59_19250 [Microbacterium sp. Se5.02b]
MAAALMAMVLGAQTPASADMPDGVEWDPATVESVYAPAEGYYAYAPSVVRDGDTEWIWTCHNDEFRVIEDHIYLTKRVDGVVVSSESVLQASTGAAWDSFHTCDPSVVKGRFDWDGTRYRYAMFYLGNDVDASAHNQIGVAFAEDPEGPWLKYPDPIVTTPDTTSWGAGQPTAVSLSAASGRVILGYTRGDSSTRAYVVTVDLSRVDRLRVSPERQVTNAGLTGADGAPDYLNGFDMAIDPSRREVMVVREQHPYPVDNPWWIGPSVQVDRMPLKHFLRGTGTWAPSGDIDEELTGFDRVHNAGLVRTWTGELPEPDAPEVVFTSSCSSLPTVDDQDWSQATCDSLYSYDLWSIAGTR